jgi:hypothetical protein
MVMVFLSSMRRWWHATAGLITQLSLLPATAARHDVRPTMAARRAVPRSTPALARLPARPLTPFGASSRARAIAHPSVPPRRLPARRFWITLDPHDRRHAAIGGSFAEVCAALEQLAATEERCN